MYSLNVTHIFTGFQSYLYRISLVSSPDSCLRRMALVLSAHYKSEVNSSAPEESKGGSRGGGGGGGTRRAPPLKLEKNMFFGVKS